MSKATSQPLLSPQAQAIAQLQGIIRQAIKVGNVGAITQLLQKGTIRPDAVIDPQGNSLVHYAAVHGKDDILGLLINNYGVSPNLKGVDGFTPLHFAVKAGHQNCAAALVAHHDIEVDAQDNLGQTPLYLAIRHNQLAAIPTLLEKEANPLIPTHQGICPLYRMHDIKMSPQWTPGHNNCYKRMRDSVDPQRPKLPHPVRTLIRPFSWSSRHNKPQELAIHYTTQAMPFDPDSPIGKRLQAEKLPLDGQNLTPPQEEALETILAEYTKEIGIRFIRTDNPSDAQLHFRRAALPNQTHGNTVLLHDDRGTISSACISFDASWENPKGTTWIKTQGGRIAKKDEYYKLMVHEIGHALGLKHPARNGVTREDGTKSPLTWQESIMLQGSGNALPEGGQYPTKPQRNDIAALKYIYQGETTTTPYL